jgi:hypothetical protein
MLRSGITRAIASALFAASGLVLVGGVVITGAAPAGAQTPCPGGDLCITPSSGLVNHQSVEVVVKGKKANANEEIAVTECNANLAESDPDACNSSASDLGKPGGPALAETNARGNATISYKVLVSSKKAVGDGFCAPDGNGGEPCFLIAASVSTEEPITNPGAFSTGG